MLTTCTQNGKRPIKMTLTLLRRCLGEHRLTLCYLADATLCRVLLADATLYYVLHECTTLTLARV